MNTVTDTVLGTYSEVGKLHTVMVHRPDLAHERLSPSNCHELLFDDVIWVRRARQEFDAFVDLMRDRGVEVLLVHELLARDARGQRGPRMAADAPHPAGGRDGHVRRAHPRVAPRDAGRRARDPADRRHHRARAAERDAIDDRARAPPDRLRPAPASEPALHPRHERVAVRRRVAQSDVLAGPAARDAEHGGDLSLPSPFSRRGVRDLVRRGRPGLGLGAASKEAT